MDLPWVLSHYEIIENWNWSTLIWAWDFRVSCSNSLGNEPSPSESNSESVEYHLIYCQQRFSHPEETTELQRLSIIRDSSVFCIQSLSIHQGAHYRDSNIDFCGSRTALIAVSDRTYLLTGRTFLSLAVLIKSEETPLTLGFSLHQLRRWGFRKQLRSSDRRESDCLLQPYHLIFIYGGWNQVLWILKIHCFIHCMYLGILVIYREDQIKILASIFYQFQSYLISIEFISILCKSRTFSFIVQKLKNCKKNQKR